MYYSAKKRKKKKKERMKVGCINYTTNVYNSDLQFRPEHKVLRYMDSFLILRFGGF